MRSLLFALVALGLVATMALWSGCAHKAPPPPVTEEPQLIEFYQEEPIYEEPVYMEPEYETDIVVQEPPLMPVETHGYRVQIGAFRNFGGAQTLAAKAENMFREAVYIEEVGGLFKVRVGDLVTRAEADLLRGRAGGLGFSDAFVVETMITPSK
jgi:cell division septation protein DedD